LGGGGGFGFGCVGGGMVSKNCHGQERGKGHGSPGGTIPSESGGGTISDTRGTRGEESTWVQTTKVAGKREGPDKNSGENPPGRG